MKSVIAILVLLIVLSLVVVHPITITVNAKSKDSKARDAILKVIGKSVEGRYSTIDMVNISKKNDNSSITVYNKTVPVIINPPQPPPNPPPVPTGITTKVCLVGDLKGSTVPNLMKDCNLKVGIGDLGYASDLSYFKGLKFDKCVVGNHDSPEDGSSSIYKEALTYCGDHWAFTTANGTTLIIGLNTNGDENGQINFVKSLPLTKYKNVMVVSHKNGHTFPNAHHPAEAKTLYAELEKLVPNLYEITGHNHNEAAAANGHWFISGAGGKSHYTCGTNAEWPTCDNTHYGYLELTISNKDGTTAAKFIN